jgi:hypothetical protein
MKNNFILENETLLRVNNSTLFYPCSGNDLSVPIKIFSPFVNDFWFVDRGYFSPGHQDTRGYGYDVSADKQIPVLNKDKKYNLIETKTTGPVSWHAYNHEIEPCVLTETYEHLPTKNKIRIHRRRGYGFSAFRKEIDSIGVFFYRGDSQGEGGSGNLWLASEHINEVCDKLIDGGLIVTDGCQHGHTTEHRELWKYHRCNCQIEPEEIIKSMEPFTDKSGRRFTCVGYAGQRYEPTLVWQVYK